MPRPPSITYSEFKKTAVSLTAEGKKLTYQVLREHLGGVSHDVLKRYLEQFQQERGLSNSGMPETVLSGAHAIYEQAREVARTEIQREYAVLMQALESERAELAEERLQLTRVAASATGQADVLQSQVLHLQAVNQQLIESLVSALAEVKEMVSDARNDSTMRSVGIQEQLEVLRGHVCELGNSVKAMFEKAKQEDIPK